jgi:hypothetical protein
MHPIVRAVRYRSNCRDGKNTARPFCRSNPPFSSVRSLFCHFERSRGISTIDQNKVRHVSTIPGGVFAECYEKDGEQGKMAMENIRRRTMFYLGNDCARLPIGNPKSKIRDSSTRV